MSDKNDEILEKLNNFIDSSENEMIFLESLLTKHKALSPESGGDGEEEKALALESWLKENGFNDIKRYNAPDSRVSCGSRPNIVVTIPGESDEYSIWCMSHLDVVPIGELSSWNTNPWEVVVKDGKIFGRGVEDNQQGLVSSVFASLAYLKNSKKPSHTVKLLFMADEETGSEYGVSWLLKNTDLFKKEDLILIPDGGDSLGRTIEIAEKNILWLKFHVFGKQVHGSRPDTGKNASIAGSYLALKINALEKKFKKRNPMFQPDYSTFQPTMRFENVQGVNIIPGEDVFCVDSRILPCYSIDFVLSKIEKLCKKCEKKFGVQVCYEILQQNESPQTDKNSLVVKKLLESIKKVHKIEPVCIGIGGGTVAAEFRKLGYPCAVWSTLDECAHTPNEYAKIENIIKDAKTLVHFFLI